MVTNVRKHSPLSTSHNLITLSRPPDNRYKPPPTGAEAATDDEVDDDDAEALVLIVKDVFAGALLSGGVTGARGVDNDLVSTPAILVDTAPNYAYIPYHTYHIIHIYHNIDSDGYGIATSDLMQHVLDTALAIAISARAVENAIVSIVWV